MKKAILTLSKIIPREGRKNQSISNISHTGHLRIAAAKYFLFIFLPKTLLFVLVFLFCISGFLFAQKTVGTDKGKQKTPMLEKPVELSEKDISETAQIYRTDNADAKVALFQKQMPAPVTDPKIRTEINNELPLMVKQLAIKDPLVPEQFRRVILPVLALFSRDKTYDIIVFRHPTPILFSDTGVLLVISTGMIERASSDDELIGYVAHEIGHEYYARYSIYSRHLLKLIAENGRETALSRKYLEALAIIELQCDGFAVIALNMLGYNSLSFIEGFEKTSRDFPGHNYGAHPPDEQRRRLVEQIAPKSNLTIKPRTSDELMALKALISELK